MGCKKHHKKTPITIFICLIFILNMPLENQGNSAIKQFWARYESKLVLGLGLVLIAVIAFEMGYAQGRARPEGNIIIERPSGDSKISPELTNSATISSSGSQSESSTKEANLVSSGTVTTSEKCAYVGSKNSDKFYPPSCSYAKRIKPENVVCFATAEEALGQGRMLSTGCAK